MSCIAGLSAVRVMMPPAAVAVAIALLKMLAGLRTISALILAAASIAFAAVLLVRDPIAVYISAV